jgi:site-specific recombinase XerD
MIDDISSLRVTEVVELWLADLQSLGRCDRTIESYRRDLRDFHLALAHHVFGRPILVDDMAEIRQEQIDLVKSVWESAGVSRQTMARRFSAVRGYAAHLSVEAGLNCSRVLAATFPTAQSNRIPEAELHDLRAMSSVAPDSSWTALRNAAAFLTMACGMITSEALALNREDVHVMTGVAIVNNTSPRKRIVCLSSEARRAISAYLAARPLRGQFSSPLFQTSRGTRLSARSLQYAFRLRRRALGLSEALVPTSLRHSAGRQKAQRWRSPAAVARLLGIDPANTRRYFE